jgi:hypothetical protein
MKAIRSYALIAGISLITMALAAGFSYGYVFSNLIDLNDAEKTLENLSNGQAQYNGSIAGWVIIWITDLLVAWALYHFFKPVKKNLSLITACLRLVYTFILGWAIIQLLTITTHLPGASPDFVLERILSFEWIWSLGLIIFGFHLLLLGFLVLYSKNVPNIWGVLLIIAGPAYTFLSLMQVTSWMAESQISQIEMWLMLPMTVSELGLAIWLLVRGGKSIQG